MLDVDCWCRKEWYLRGGHGEMLGKWGCWRWLWWWCRNGEKNGTQGAAMEKCWGNRGCWWWLAFGVGIAGVWGTFYWAASPAPYHLAFGVGIAGVWRVAPLFTVGQVSPSVTKQGGSAFLVEMLWSTVGGRPIQSWLGAYHAWGPKHRATRVFERARVRVRCFVDAGHRGNQRHSRTPVEKW